MKAVYIREFGGPENLEIREVDAPGDPKGNEVLVRVGASALNRADLLQRKGFYPAPEGYPERIPGLEFAGTVIACGPSAGRFREGDRVFGITAGGAQAEFVLTREDHLAPVPPNLGLVDAAAVPEAFITAHDAVWTQGGLSEGETLLIHAVGSGVGLAALQIAKARGNRVIGTSRTEEKLEKCREFGLDLAIDTGIDPGFSKKIENGAEVILDLVGGAYLEENLKSLAQKGRLIIVGLVGGRKAEFDLGTALTKRLTIKGTVLRSRSDEEKAGATAAFARDILPLLESGSIVPNVERVFAAEDVREAHEHLESNESFGKVVLEFSEQ
ncbi:MAG: NAD(P)H-quinone oxidoreductase [Aridibacter famidurans]|nr:NAD(P)H-quinone oxidoreductase [Aridibacter famidurans]